MSATTLDTSRYQHQAEVWADLVALWERRQNTGSDFRGVFWFGAAGTGKTHLARKFCAQARTLRLHRDEGLNIYTPRVFEGSALELVAETQAAIGKNKDARDLFTMHEEIKRAHVVFLDDLGREREDYGQSVMFSLLDVALSRNAFVIVTANRSARELAEYYKGDAGLRSRLSALMSREWPATLPNLRKPA